MRRFALLVAGLALLTGVVAGLSGGATQIEARWVIRDLGTLGGKQSHAVDVNQRGQVVGWADTKSKDEYSPTSHAFLWEKGKMTDLGTLGGEDSAALAINEHGQVVGWANTKAKRANGGQITHAFLWENGRMRDLGTLGGPESSASDVNDRGQVIGWADTKAKTKDGRFYLRHAFLWQSGTMRDLGTLGGRESSAFAINEHGWVVGSADTRAETKEWGILSPVEHACLWRAGRIRDLGMARAKRSTASDINDHGQVVGSLDTGRKDAESKYGDEPIWHAFLWESGEMRDLTAHGPNSTASAVNGRGQIVGAWWKLGNSGSAPWDRAALWQGGKMILVGSPSTSHANDVNNRGQIVGWSVAGFYDYDAHAVLWTLKRG